MLRTGLVLPFLPQATLASTTTTCAPILSNPSISTLRKNGRQVTILGTAHVSDASAELSRDLVRSLQPDTVFIELDAKRVKGGKFGETDNASSTGSSTTTKKPSFVSNLKSKILGKIIGSMYSKLSSYGFSTGLEFTYAIQEGSKLGSKIVLGDRDVDVTLTRLSDAISSTDISTVDFTGLDSQLASDIDIKDLADPKDLDKTQISDIIETMKQRDNVTKLMKELEREMPLVYNALVKERDEYMAKGINDLNESNVMVAVCGIAHLEGMERTLKEEGWSVVDCK
ncbi:hypothetical protein TL16_g04192 [Triparma laevis f. inornata]|uniref:TraB family protein n=1 Tax=Triparma laevis f. inornata TaxID=1714386 RepID=A0A9W7E427_9STRA|nr:hypothetical protein TL16_g04192 [Triparma laevis f. inornata]